MKRRWAIVFTAPYRNGGHEHVAEWFDTKEAAIARAEKVMRDLCFTVSLVEEVATVTPSPEWCFR